MMHKNNNGFNQSWANPLCGLENQYEGCLDAAFKISFWLSSVCNGNINFNQNMYTKEEFPV